MNLYEILPPALSSASERVAAFRDAYNMADNERGSQGCNKPQITPELARRLVAELESINNAIYDAIDMEVARDAGDYSRVFSLKSDTAEIDRLKSEKEDVERLIAQFQQDDQSKLQRIIHATKAAKESFLSA